MSVTLDISVKDTCSLPIFGRSGLHQSALDNIEGGSRGLILTHKIL